MKSLAISIMIHVAVLSFFYIKKGEKYTVIELASGGSGGEKKEDEEITEEKNGKAGKTEKELNREKEETNKEELKEKETKLLNLLKSTIELDEKVKKEEEKKQKIKEAKREKKRREKKQKEEREKEKRNEMNKQKEKEKEKKPEEKPKVEKENSSGTGTNSGTGIGGNNSSGIGTGTGPGIGSGNGNEKAQALTEGISKIQAKIMKHWAPPEKFAARKDIIIEIELTLNIDGEIESFRIINRKEDEAYKCVAESVLRAIQDPRVNPLPINKNKELTQIILRFCPRDMI